MERQPHIETDSPIIGVLELPIYARLEQQLDSSPESYIEASHVKYLESAGAKVMAVPWDVSPKELKKLMQKLNGMYIPGDQRSLLENPQFSRTVAAIVQYA